MCAFLLAVLILHGVVDVPAALESKLVTQLWSSIPPLHHRLHLNRSKAENGFVGAQVKKKWPRNETRQGHQNVSFRPLHLVGLHDTTILGPDSFKGGLDVVVPLDHLMIIRL